MRKGYKVSVSLNKKLISNDNKKCTKKSSKSEKKDIEIEESMNKGIDIINNYKDSLEEKRKERVGKTLIEARDEYIEEYEEEKERKQGIRKLILTFSIIATVIVIYLFFQYGPIIGISLNKDVGIDDENSIDILSTDDDIYMEYCSELLIYSNKHLSTYNKYGKKTWEYDIEEAFTPEIYIYDKYMAMTNNSSGTIYLFENKKEILNKKVEGTIYGVYIDEHGNMAIEYSTTGYKKAISVYTKSGKLMYNTYLNSDAIIDIKLLENGKKLLVFESDAYSFTISSKISIIDGTKETDNITQVAQFDNNLIYDVVVQNKDVILKLDDRIVSCNIDTKTVVDIKTFDSSQILFVALAKNYYVLVEKKLGEEEVYSIENFMFDNNNISTMNIDNSPKLMKNTGTLNYFIYQDKLQVINKWGVEIKNVDISFPPKEIVVFNNEKTIALIYTNKIYTVTM